VAALFALHPLRVESVVWIAERKDVLSTLFWLLSLLAYRHYARQTNLRRYFLVALCFALGLMAKPMVVTLPCVLLLLDYWPLNRLNSPADLRRLFVEKLPLFALSAVSSFVTFKVQKAGGAVVPVDLLPLYARLENALLSYGHYLAKMFWPDRLGIPVPFVDVRTVRPAILMAGMVVAGVTIAVIWLGKRHKYLPVGWFLYLGTLVPVIGIVQVGGQGAAYRYTYIPSIGIALLVVWGLAEVFRRGQIPRSAIAAFALTAFSVCAALSFNQLGFWRNTETLFKHSLSIYPNHLDTANALAWSYATNPDRRQRNGPEAVRLAQFCLERCPFPDGQYLDTLAAAFAECGEFERAVEIEEKVLALPRLPADLISQVKDHLELFKSGKTVNGPKETSIAPETP
jgi:tetratricopeptide (TPR) repeat protein